MEMVTKIKLRAFVLLIIMFFTALFVGGAFVYSLFLISALLMLSAFIAGRNTSKNLVNIVWKNSDRLQVGNSFNLSIELYNSGIFPVPYLMLSTQLSRKLTGESERKKIFSLLPGEKTVVKKEMVCKNKGIYKVGYMELEYGDALGIFNWKMVSDSNIMLFVYPRVHDLKHFKIPLRQHFGTAAVRHNAYEDFASIRDIRKYENGDSLKKIHWKVTAHKGELHIKNVELNATADVNVFLDLYEGSYEGDLKDEMEELGAECAASIVRYALNKNMSVSFIAKGDNFTRISGSGISRFGEFLDAITRTEVNGDTPINEIIRHEGQKLNLGATAIIITSSISESMLETMLSYKAKGVGFVFVYLSVDSNEIDKNVEVLKQHDIVVYVVGLGDNIVRALGGHYEK